MTFSFFSYLLNNLMLPVFAIVFVGYPVFQTIFRLIGQKVRGEQVELPGFQAVLMFIVLIVLLVILFNMLISGGGLGLITDRADDALTVEGVIEEIHPGTIWSNPRYTVNGEISNGYTLVIDGVECFSMAKGELEIGDTVSASYMPKTGYVLNIQEINP